MTSVDPENLLDRVHGALGWITAIMFVGVFVMLAHGLVSTGLLIFSQ